MENTTTTGAFLKAGIGSEVKVGLAYRYGGFVSDEFTGAIGTVTDVDGDDCLVVSGPLEFWIRRDRLRVCRGYRRLVR